MKVFNQIPAEVSGVIAEVLCRNGDSVEFGQPLFRVRPGLAVAMAVFLLAILGFPIAGGMGFFAKFYVLQAALAPAAGEPVIDKTKNNAFAGTRLGELVDKKAAIIVVGMQSDFCIRATCSAALGRGNTVFLVEDAHSTYDRPEAYAGGGPVLVTPARTVVREIESELEEAGVFVVKLEDLPHVFTDS